MAESPNDIAARWANRLSGAGDKIRAGVQGVTQAPGARAAAQKARYVAGVQAKADKWAAKVGSVSLSDWQTAMTEKGIPSIAQGATAAQGKMTSFFTQLIPYINANVGAIRSMPSLTIEDSVNRAAAWIRTMSKFSYKK